MPEVHGEDFKPGGRAVRDPMDFSSPALSPSPTSRTTTDVYLVEDYPILRDGMRTILEGAGHRVVGEADHPTPAIADLARLEPPVAVVTCALTITLASMCWNRCSAGSCRRASSCSA